MPKEFYKERIKFLTNEIRMNKNAVNDVPKTTKEFFKDLIKRQEKELLKNKLELAKAERKEKRQKNITKKLSKNYDTKASLSRLERMRRI